MGEYFLALAYCGRFFVPQVIYFIVYQTGENMEKKNFTIADIAQELGISKTTVSRSISGKGRISDATRERVLTYIEENGYKPNIIAKSLANSCTYNIGVIMPEKFSISDASFFVDCLSGVYNAVSAREYDILMTACNNIDMSSLERMVERRKVDGAILMRTFVEDRAIRLLKEAEIPFVVVGRTSCKDVVQVDQDNEKACQELVSILIQKTMEQPALIGGSMDQVVNQNRFEGYLSACQNAQIIVQEERIYTDCIKLADIHAAIFHSLENGAKCIACMDDNICAETLKCLKELGVNVPGEVKVASFFSSPLLENNTPPVTSISFDVNELGIVSGNTLIDIIEKKEFSDLTLLGYKIKLEKSTQ